MKTLNAWKFWRLRRVRKSISYKWLERHTISGYVDLDLYFRTKEGPVKIRVEAYVIKGMTNPLILGNDFANQYSLLVKRVEGRLFLEFRESGQSLDITNLVSPEFINEDGHAFKVWRISSTSTGLLMRIDHQQNQWMKWKTRFQASDQNIWSRVKIFIPPETCVTVMDIGYILHILLILSFLHQSFVIKSLHHSTYFLTYLFYITFYY